jgi:acyl-homoserine lactone acylase PvdQ
VITTGLLMLASLGPAACAPLASAYEGVFAGRAERLAGQVTIHRDEWGVPHIYGPTDESVVFGMAYAQAEDNFVQIERDFVVSLGRAAELDGDSVLEGDIVRAAFEVQRLSRDEYEREPPERKRLWDAFAHGLNYYLQTHPAARPRLLTHFEPWFAFARFRSASPGTSVDGVRLGDVIAVRVDSAANPDSPSSPGPAREEVPEAAEAYGSNAWAVSPALTAAGHALLFQNPHVSFFGSGQRYELHLQSDEGWHFSGFAILGTPMPRAGHNEHLAWTHTNTAADGADAFELTFDHPTDPLSYRFGDGWRRAVEWEDTLLVRRDTVLEPRIYRFRRTHHGPVVARPDARPVAIRLARFAEGGSLQQWYAMGRATSLEQFRAALGLTSLPISNTMYADRDGNIMYVHGNAVPRRAPGFDWTRPVDGSDPATEWQGYHALEELPQLVNPESGWLQNTNSTPFLATADGYNLRREDYPSYMARESQNERARVSRLILQSDSAWTFEEWAAAAFDSRVNEAAEHIPLVIDEWERLGATDPDAAAQLDTAVELLRGWNQRSTLESVETTIFVLWLERFRRRAPHDTARFARTAALAEVVSQLERDWGTQRVPWGEINRLQRPGSSGVEPFDDFRHSLPVPGAPGWTGIVFNFTTRPGPGKLRYGVSGHTWVSVVDLGPQPRALSVVTFGQSGNPRSPHYFDQAALYAQGRFKQAWFWREDVERNAQRTYRPGTEAAVSAAAR